MSFSQSTRLGFVCLKNGDVLRGLVWGLCFLHLFCSGLHFLAFFHLFVRLCLACEFGCDTGISFGDTSFALWESIQLSLKQFFERGEEMIMLELWGKRISMRLGAVEGAVAHRQAHYFLFILMGGVLDLRGIEKENTLGCILVLHPYILIDLVYSKQYCNSKSGPLCDLARE